MRVNKKSLLSLTLLLLIGLLYIYNAFALQMIGDSSPVKSNEYDDVDKIPLTNITELDIESAQHLSEPITLQIDFKLPFVLFPESKVIIEDGIILKKDGCRRILFHSAFRRNRPFELRNLVVDSSRMELELVIYLRSKKRMWSWRTEKIDISKNTKFKINLGTDDLGYNRAIVERLQK